PVRGNPAGVSGVRVLPFIASERTPGENSRLLASSTCPPYNPPTLRFPLSLLGCTTYNPREKRKEKSFAEYVKEAIYQQKRRYAYVSFSYRDGLAATRTRTRLRRL